MAGIAAAIDRAIEAPLPDRAAIRLDGARETARLLARFTGVAAALA
jgi:predicted glycosyltransferase